MWLHHETTQEEMEFRTLSSCILQHQESFHLPSVTLSKLSILHIYSFVNYKWIF